MRKRLLFAAPHMMLLAKRIVAVRPDEITLAEISRWEPHKNGQPNIFIGGFPGGIDLLRQSSVSVLLGFTDQATFFSQFCMLGELVKLDPAWLQLLIPYEATAASERASREGEVPNAETFATILSALVAPGPVRATYYDLHALPVKGFPGAALRPILRSGLSVVKQHVQKLGIEDEVVFVSPDAGADKRNEDHFNGTHGDRTFPTAVCGKKRKDGEVFVTLERGDVRGRIAIIVDDMMRSFKTVIECAKALMRAGAKMVYIWGTHADFEPGAVERVTLAATVDKHLTGIEEVWVSDSCPIAAYAVDGVKPFRVLSLDEKLAADVCNDPNFFMGQETFKS